MDPFEKWGRFVGRMDRYSLAKELGWGGGVRREYTKNENGARERK